MGYITINPCYISYTFYSNVRNGWCCLCIYSGFIVKDIGAWILIRKYVAKPKISSLHNRYPVDIFDEAVCEAEELTKEKKT
ncbi:MAG: hypothetical protein J7L07_11225 [Candidatus Odinarchaeota archaeon]|nr:hypothetical protein [Candidatus Odinarchaeota archaeon]